MDYPEYYKILELPIDAKAADIKRQYRKFAKKYHPDMNPDNEAAGEIFKKIKEAYDTLSDEKKRAEYDANWKKERDDEFKKEQKEKHSKAVKKTKIIKSEAKAPKTKNKRSIWKAVKVFFELTAVFAVIFYLLGKFVAQEKTFLFNVRSLDVSVPDFKNMTSNISGYFVKREVLQNKVAEVEKKLQKKEKNGNIGDEYSNIVNFKNGDGYSLLMLAKTAEMSKLLIENGADVNYTANDGENALLIAVKNDNKEQVKVLLEAGANPEVKDLKSGFNALMLAKSDEVAYFLLKKGANPNFIAGDGTTALGKAAAENNHQRLNLLQQFGARINWSDVIGK